MAFPSAFSGLRDARGILLANEDETAAFGGHLARLVRPGSVWSFRGPLGVGKTALVRCILRALAGDAVERNEAVPSPSFTLVQEYSRGGLRVLHVDMWRLGAGDSLEVLGLEEAHDDGAAIFAEWLRGDFPMGLDLTLTMSFSDAANGDGDSDGDGAADDARRVRLEGRALDALSE